MTKILLINTVNQYLDILHLTKEEERILADQDDDLTETEKVEHILDGRNIPYDDFNPIWMYVDDDIPVFDEFNNDIPLCVLR